MAWITTKATLAKAPNQIQTKTGTPMVTGFCFARLGGDCSDLPLAIVAFGSIAEELLQYDKGQTVQISGDLKIHTYTNNQQQPVEQIQVTLDTLAGGKNSKPVRHGESQQRRQQSSNGQANNGSSSAHQGQHQAPAISNAQNQYQGDMGFQQRPNQPAPQIGQPMGAGHFTDDDINF
ncbi:single-stranded DNA-binding protein [Thiomicrorhabdus cannonii]|uniref:single-stranded DNA-binding protein n=1 Tax=Thiomicrorhabdus cannonii TaxID=2748011 RepID=UPI0015BAB304|nr:single-stranded DNA-binding protein [Thiomicrorhabdus cannonii]